ncbi:ankyrin repeat domain-containing protein [Aliamphritea hakodatensis]|uniref:ankyrin repeat domain-containing protein n=1 Tax=Aliamphritea hakodatensis TaxID=2895352 RepID=UPI0022FD842C|nr:ankyrin repeat domain-containing protein [Aliamphritea hakodatensis]
MDEYTVRFNQNFPSQYLCTVFIFIALLLGNSVAAVAEQSEPPEAQAPSDVSPFIQQQLQSPEGLFELLMIGVFSDDLDLIEQSLINQVNLKSTTEQGESPIFIAAALGNERVVKLLLSYRNEFDLNKPNNEGISPLMAAVMGEHTGVVKMLIDAGADYKASNFNEGQIQSVQSLALASNDPDLVELFDKERADALRLNINLIIASSDLFDGAIEGDVDRVRNSLEFFTDTDRTTILDENGWSPLMHAAANGHLNVVKFLVDASFDVNQQYGEERLTILMAAAANDDIDLAKYIISQGGRFSLRQKNGLTAAQIARAVGATSVLTVLEGTHKSADAFVAAKTGDIGALLGFMKKRNVSAMTDDKAWTPFFHAVNSNQLKAAVLILSKYNSRPVHHMTVRGESPMTIAIANGNMDMVKLLVRHGAPIEKNIKGDLPLDALAAQLNQQEIAKYLKAQRKELTLELQRELLIAGYKVGKPDGIAGGMTKKALVSFNKTVTKPLNYRETINYLRSGRGKRSFYVCNVSKKKKVFYAVANLRNYKVGGWWGVDKNRCRLHTSKIGMNGEATFLHSTHFKNFERTELICAPQTVIDHSTSKKCKAMETFYHVPLTDKGIVVWIGG